jgi:Ohr subfamily peroxiredoxin
LDLSLDYFTCSQVVATGGRKGSLKSADGHLVGSLTLPKNLGGTGESGLNPETLFAGGYSACFQGAMGVAARNLKLSLPDSNTVAGKSV